MGSPGRGRGDSEAAKVQGFRKRAIERSPGTLSLVRAWGVSGCGRRRCVRVGPWGTGISPRRSEAYLPRQVGLRRWAWGLERGHFGGEAEVREYATDGKWIGDASERGFLEPSERSRKVRRWVRRICLRVPDWDWARRTRGGVDGIG